MREEYTFDRIEGDKAVCISRRDGRIAEIPALTVTEAGVPPGGIFSAELVGDEPVNIEYLAQETADIKSRSHRRLSALFNRRKGK